VYTFLSLCFFIPNSDNFRSCENRNRHANKKIPNFKFEILFFKWFISVVYYNIKYQIDIRWVSQNTTLCCVLTYPPYINLIFDIEILLDDIRFGRRLTTALFQCISATFISNFFLLWPNSPWWAKASSLSRIHDHTETHHTR